jgi:nucleoside phosphorylase
MPFFSVLKSPPKANCGRLGKARVALLTITTDEFAIASDAFALHENLIGSPYYVSRRHDGVYDIVLRRCLSQTNLVSHEVAGSMVEDFRPSFVIMIGTAGGYSGRDGLALGDVVVSDYIESSNYWKHTQSEVKARKVAFDHPSLFLLDRFVEALRVDDAPWRQLVRTQRPEPGQPKLLIGEIVAGDRLLGDPDSAEQKRILNYFDKALAFEMEAAGLARTIYRARESASYNPQFLVIRGISDFVDIGVTSNQSTRRAWTPYAVACAVAVASALLQKLLPRLKTIENSQG